MEGRRKVKIGLRVNGWGEYKIKEFTDFIALRQDLSLFRFQLCRCKYPDQPMNYWFHYLYTAPGTNPYCCLYFAIEMVLWKKEGLKLL